jgi:hypothetical protein
VSEREKRRFDGMNRMFRIRTGSIQAIERESP